MILVTTVLWDANQKTKQCALGKHAYRELHVQRLYEYLKPCLAVPWKLVVFTDRYRKMPGEQILLEQPPGYPSEIEPYRLDEPMINMGLDTVPVGNMDNLADFVQNTKGIYLSKNPEATKPNLGVQLVPRGFRKVYESFDWSRSSAMDHVRSFASGTIDKVFPGYVQSYKWGPNRKEARILYFHGNPKPTHCRWWLEGKPCDYQIPRA